MALIWFLTQSCIFETGRTVRMSLVNIFAAFVFGSTSVFFRFASFFSQTQDGKIYDRNQKLSSLKSFRLNGGENSWGVLILWRLAGDTNCSDRGVVSSLQNACWHLFSCAQGFGINSIKSLPFGFWPNGKSLISWPLTGKFARKQQTDWRWISNLIIQVRCCSDEKEYPPRPPCTLLGTCPKVACFVSQFVFTRSLQNFFRMPWLGYIFFNLVVKFGWLEIYNGGASGQFTSKNDVKWPCVVLVPWLLFAALVFGTSNPFYFTEIIHFPSDWINLTRTHSVVLKQTFESRGGSHYNSADRIQSGSDWSERWVAQETLEESRFFKNWNVGTREALPLENLMCQGDLLLICRTKGYRTRRWNIGLVSSVRFTLVFQKFWVKIRDWWTRKSSTPEVNGPYCTGCGCLRSYLAAMTPPTSAQDSWVKRSFKLIQFRWEANHFARSDDSAAEDFLSQLKPLRLWIP